MKKYNCFVLNCDMGDRSAGSVIIDNPGRDYEKEIKDRVYFIQQALSHSKTKGLVYGNSGGKDSALVGILCKLACDNTIGIIMPCQSRRNFEEDRNDAYMIAEQYKIETRFADLTKIKEEMQKSISLIATLSANASNNINPRLRMTLLYAISSSENRLVVGTGNKSEAYMGYFTKWGDGAYDINPIADLTVTEIYEFLKYLGAPDKIINKEPSAGLFDGQTDEGEMGVKYTDIDNVIMGHKIDNEIMERISTAHELTEHKRKGQINYQSHVFPFHA